jgi:hypothetical protein
MDNIYGYMMTNGDKFDFRPALKGTAWNGTAATVNQFLRVAQSGNDAIISISPAANGAGSMVADLHSTGGISMTTLLAHSLL